MSLWAATARLETSAPTWPERKAENETASGCKGSARLNDNRLAEQPVAQSGHRSWDQRWLPRGMRFTRGRCKKGRPACYFAFGYASQPSGSVVRDLDSEDSSHPAATVVSEYDPGLSNGDQPGPEPEQAITIAQGIQAFTSNAVWQYGLENQVGSIARGLAADLVFLSEDLLSMESNPDELMNIEVLATMHHGVYLPKPNPA
jgi:Amidohydrolase family